MRFISDLKIGDSLWMIDESIELLPSKDRWGYEYVPERIKEILITRMEGYYGDIVINAGGYDFRLNKEEYNSPSFRWRSYCITADDRSKDDLMIEQVIDEIKRLEENTKKTKEINDAKIKELRRNYWHLLNKSNE